MRINTHSGVLEISMTIVEPVCCFENASYCRFQALSLGWCIQTHNADFRLLELPQPSVVPNMTAQLLDNTDFRRKLNLTEDEKVQLLAEFHHKFVAIHPFTNGNGRMARLLTDILAASLGYENIDLYAASGIKRQRYLDALEAAGEMIMRRLLKWYDRCLPPCEKHYVNVQNLVGMSNLQKTAAQHKLPTQLCLLSALRSAMLLKTASKIIFLM